VKTALKFGVVALVALVFVMLPGGGRALDVAAMLLTIVFFAAIALFGFRLYRENQLTLDALEPRQRAILYGSVALAFLVFTATSLLFAVGLPGVLIWLALLGGASSGVFWVLVRSRRID